MSDPAQLKALVLRLAGGLGFARVGVAPAGASGRAKRFQQFLERGHHAGMTYLARDPAARCDVRSMLGEAASVICLAVAYKPAAGDEASGHIARYARGRDYHRVLRGRCRRLVAELSRAEPGLKARVCVDTAPVLERDLAAAGGLGWIGRNGCLVDRELGSYLLLAEIVTNLPLAPDGPVKSRCGSCRACVEACPTGAIGESGLVDSRRCISYLTIEHHGEIPRRLRPRMGRWVFGCDVCQEVCPWNRRAPAGDAELRGLSVLAETPLAAMLDWTEADWDRETRGSAGRRARYEMFLRNAAIAAGNGRDPALRAALERLAGHPSDLVGEAARTALRQLTNSLKS